MYRYEYVAVTAEMEGYLAKFNGKVGLDRYREIIDARAAEGWRYAGWMPTRESREGFVRELDLIFEKEV